MKYTVVEFKRNREEAVHQTMIPPVLGLLYTVQECSDTVLSMALTVFQFS